MGKLSKAGKAKKQAQARSLRAEGLSFREISERLNTPLSTLHGWVQGVEAGGGVAAPAPVPETAPAPIEPDEHKAPPSIDELALKLAELSEAVIAGKIGPSAAHVQLRALRMQLEMANERQAVTECPEHHFNLDFVIAKAVMAYESVFTKTAMQDLRPWVDAETYGIVYRVVTETLENGKQWLGAIREGMADQVPMPDTPTPSDWELALETYYQAVSEEFERLPERISRLDYYSEYEWKGHVEDRVGTALRFARKAQLELMGSDAFKRLKSDTVDS